MFFFCLGLIYHSVEIYFRARVPFYTIGAHAFYTILFCSSSVSGAYLTELRFIPDTFHRKYPVFTIGAHAVSHHTVMFLYCF